MKKLKFPTKKEFQAYESVRCRGAYNMITQAHEAAKSAGLSINCYMNVLKNYELCMKKWPEVRL